MRVHKLLLVVSALAAVVGVTATSATSDACGAAISFGTRFDLPKPAAKRPPMEMLLSAEKRLDHGDSSVSATQVLMAFPEVTHAPIERATVNEARALRDIAVAIVRSSGATGPAGASMWASTEQRADNLAWATRTLRQLSAKDPSDVVVKTDLGESLVAVGETEDEGREVLEALAASDLLATSFGYEALAKERGLAGDAEAMNAALTRCRAMAVDASICRAEVAGTTGSLASELAVRAFTLFLAVVALFVSTGCQRARSEKLETSTFAADVASARAPVADAAVGKLRVAAYECNRCHEDTGHPPMSEEKHCVRCHQTIFAGKFSMQKATPALIEKWKKSIVHLREVPSLGRVGVKFRREWLASFLLRPNDLRPHLEESMPRFRMTPEDAADISAFLIPTESAPITPDASLAAEGKKLFDQKGCATCHQFSGAKDVTPSPIPVALSNEELTRGAKFAPDLRFARDRLQTAMVRDWIRDPKSIDAPARMPSLGLTEDEATKLASYVLTTPLDAPVATTVPQKLPLLERQVAYAEVEKRVLRNTCWHCHAEPGLALGDGGPGNSGGLGFPPRGLNLAEYEGLAAGVKLDDDKRHSVLKAGDDGSPPMLVAALLARQVEEAGGEVPGIRGMPLGLPSASPEDIQLLETWIAQGRKR